MTEIRPISFASQQVQPPRTQNTALVRFGHGDGKCGDTCDIGHKHEPQDAGKKEPGLVQKWKNKTRNFFTSWSLIQNPITWTLIGIVAGIALGGIPVAATLPAALLVGIAMAPSEGKELSSEEDKDAGKGKDKDAGKGEEVKKGKEKAGSDEEAHDPVAAPGEEAVTPLPAEEAAPTAEVIPALPRIEISEAQAAAIGQHLKDDAVAQAVNAAFDAGAFKLDGNKVVLANPDYEPDTRSKTVQRAFTLLKGLIAQPDERQVAILQQLYPEESVTAPEYQDEADARAKLAGLAAYARELSNQGKLLKLVELLNGEQSAENG